MMKKTMKLFAAIIAISIIPLNANTQEIAPFSGPVFDFAQTVRIENPELQVPREKILKVVYDTYTGAVSGKVNSTFTSAARFINMHVADGHPQENIKVAIVVHGTTSIEVTQDEFYGKHHDGHKNANAPVIAALIKEGVDIYICGQSAAFRGVTRENILPGIKFSTSAMTAHAMLQSEGYTLIPW